MSYLHQNRTVRPHLVAEVPEVRTGLAGTGLCVLAAALHLAGSDVETALLAYAVAVVVTAATVGPRSALLLAATAWGLLTGFTVHSGGQLTLGRPDAAHLAVLAGAGVVASLLGPLAHPRPAVRPAARGSRTAVRL